jgi:hypothetical protein
MSGSEPRDGLHQHLGAYVLGGLSDDDHRAFTEHLRTCATCQQELGQVSGIPRMLSLVDSATTEIPYAAELAPEPAAVADVARSRPNGVADLLAEARRRRRRRRGWLVAGATVAAAAVFGAGAWLGPGLLDSPPPSEQYTATAVGGSSAEVDINLVTRGWGTQLELACSDMPIGEEIVVYVVDDSGRELAAGSWLGTRSGYATVTGATALRPEQIRSIEVRTASGEVLATART